MLKIQEESVEGEWRLILLLIWWSTGIAFLTVQVETQHRAPAFFGGYPWS
jgi:hypothetical protein